jgi:hypothetical protein
MSAPLVEQADFYGVSISREGLIQGATMLVGLLDLPRHTKSA